MLRARRLQSRSSLPCQPLRDDLHVARFGTLRALFELELDLRPFGERLVTVACESAEVDEDVLRSFCGLDEPVALRVVEPLDGSGCHGERPPRPCVNGQRRREVRNQILALCPRTVARKGRLHWGFPR